MQQYLIPYTKEQLQNDLTLIEGVDVGNIEIVPLLLPSENELLTPSQRFGVSFWRFDEDSCLNPPQ